MAKAAVKEKSKGGRKPLWDELDMRCRLDAVRGWALQGSTDEEMYAMLGVSKDTFYKWKKEYPEFKESIKKGKQMSNGELLNSAFTQSIGFRYKDSIAVKVKDYAWFINPVTNETELKQIEKVEVVEVERYAPPNPTMNIFMLKNRMPDEYKDKHEVDVKKEVTNIYEVNIRQAIQEDPETAAALKILYKRQTASSFGEAMANTSK